MRVTVIAPPWLPVPPDGYGGTELVLDTLCRGLAAEGHDVLLCATGDSACPVDRRATYERHLGTASISPADELRHVMDAYEAAADWGADVVHDHTVTGPAWGQRHAIPIVTTNHGPFTEPLVSIYQRIAPTVPIIAISRHQASTAGAVPVHAVIHHGLDVSGIEVGDGRGDYAVFLGRMAPTKGVHEAITLAREAGLPLRIAAKMREAHELEYFDARVKPHLGGDVEYLGEIGADDKYELLRDAVCLLNPIDWPEPFGMVMIEALACGTPVVATRRGAAPEIVDHGTTGFVHTDVRDLAGALADVDRIDRAACRRAVEQRFSMQRMARDHVDVYAGLTAAARRAPEPIEITTDTIATKPAEPDDRLALAS